MSPNLQALRPAEGCWRCPALVANRRRIVHGYGMPPAPGLTVVMFVGEAPGAKGGDVTGVPFTRDRSGLRLQRILRRLGLSAESDPRVENPRLSCFVTNVVRCNPPGNRTPLRSEIETCLPYLWQEVEAWQPQIVVPVGNVAAQAMIPRLTGQPAPPIGRCHALVLGSRPLVVPMRHPVRASNADLDRFVVVMQKLLHPAEGHHTLYS
jgi:uracil-DNA glycosylase